MQTVILKNGAEECLPLVNVMMMSLRSLMQENPIAFYELVMKCRDHNHKFFGNVGDILKRLSFSRDQWFHPRLDPQHRPVRGRRRWPRHEPWLAGQEVTRYTEDVTRKLVRAGFLPRFRCLCWKKFHNGRSSAA